VHLWSMFLDLLRGVSARAAPPEPRRQPLERRPHIEPRREFDLLRAAERDAIVASHLNTRLQGLGFVQVAPRRWVDGSSAPVRRMFEMQLLKGAAMKARWGFSLDFVPHLSGGRVCWHRSNRAATFDVFVDLEDRPYASFLYGAVWLHHDLERLVPIVLERAQETWRCGSTPAGVLEIVREIRERKINSFYVYFNWHLPLTFMFLSAKTGDLTAAEAELDAYARKYELAEDVAAKLARRLRDLAPIENGRSQS
jgi:hypothetical protein